MSDDRDAMTLEKARAVARSVAHRHGGTDQALAMLDREISRQDAEAETLKKAVREALDVVAENYPLDIFPEPAPGKHGKTVDACSARGIRHGLNLVRLDLERVFAFRSAPKDACRACRDMIHELLLSELHRRAWHSDQASDAAKAHWGKMEEQNLGRCLTRYTLFAACGARPTFQLDSGD